MHDASLVAQRHVAPRQHIVCDGLPENFNTQHIRYYLLCLALDVWVHEGDMIIATDYIAEGR